MAKKFSRDAVLTEILRLYRAWLERYAQITGKQWTDLDGTNQIPKGNTEAWAAYSKIMLLHQLIETFSDDRFPSKT